MLLIGPIKSEAILLALELQIKEKQLFYGTRKQESQFIMQLFGKIEELQSTVQNLQLITTNQLSKRKLVC